ncbi:MAG: Lrp/AsnC family transcriptional regulator [Ignavibacteria bacterium]|nr:Lrp/AsnC family transcriptional regulator [Ignavibacteria bacterium]
MSDSIDLKLLTLLQKNGRMKRNDLAEKVGLSLPSVSERLRKLEESEVILGYHAVLDPGKIGKNLTAFIEVTVDSSKHYGSFLTHAKGQDDILECHAVTGEPSHLLKVRTTDTRSLEKLLGKIQAWAGVSTTRTHLVLSTAKETSEVRIDKID